VIFRNPIRFLSFHIPGEGGMEDRSARDRDLIREVLAGDHGSFGKLVAAYQNMVAGIAWRYGVRGEEIEDMVSEIFTKLYRNLHRYRPEHPFSTWLYRLSANHVLDHGRRSRREAFREELPEQLAAPGPAAGERLETRERAESVRSALGEIPPRFREAIFLVYVEGRKVEEAAAILGIPQGTVKSRLMRGRQALRRVLLRRNPELFGGSHAV
jgi:RNA polymerase sigma-70 factor (ECF subfamily)